MNIYIIAGENSGDFIGKHLIKSLKDQQSDLQLSGIGGPLMESVGLKSLFPMEKINLMGFFEVIPKIFQISRLINQTVQDILQKKPDILITIDSPGFTYRVAKKVRKHNPDIKLIHAVAPSVWAYREGRADKYAKLYDKMLTLFPFEVPYFEKRGLSTNCIGHPIFEQEFFKKGVDTKRFFTQDPESKIVAVTPGSRSGEIKRHMPIILQALDRLALKHSITILFVQPNDKLKNLLEKYLYSSKLKFIITSDRLKAFAAADCALAKSGTNTLEIASSGAPMVVGYKVNFMTAMLVRLMIKIKHACLINIIAKREIIPELLQENFTSENIFNELDRLLSVPSIAKKQVDESQKILSQIGFQSKEKPSQIAARIILGDS